MNRLATVALLLLCLGAGGASADIVFSGLVAHPLHLSLVALRALPASHVTATQVSGKGPVPLDCTGVALSALLQQAGPTFDPAKNNANLAHTLLVTGDDGYAVALSLGEIDADYGHAAAIIATDCKGAPLDAPRLVVPGDAHAGRAVRGVVTIELK